ncbi:MAG: efflux RND transporter periplasmic adaptor subunit [Acidobacteriota bacterium]
MRKYFIAGLILFVIIGSLVGVKALQIGAMIQAGESFSIPPETVSSAQVRHETWEASLSAVGTVTAVQGVLLRSEVSGTVSRIAFESGGVARQGQLLVELEASTEQARLRAAQARAELANSNLMRMRDLRKQDLVSQSDLDSAEAAFKQVAGEIDEIRVAIAKKSIRAPFTGRIGIRQVQLGQYLDVAAPIVQLQSIDPVYVDFTLPEQRASGVRPGMAVRVITDASQGRDFVGRLTAIDPQIDASTRNLKLQATLSNKDGALVPGMFARVAVILPEVNNPLVIPVTAVLNAPYGDSVFVISDEKDEKTGQMVKRVKNVTVRLGETRGDLVAVETGLQEGQLIVSAGVFKLRNGTDIVINNELAPAAEASPRPADS